MELAFSPRAKDNRYVWKSEKMAKGLTSSEVAKKAELINRYIRLRTPRDSDILIRYQYEAKIVVIIKGSGSITLE